MKVVDVRVTPVYVPMKHPLRWCLGVETGTTRTIVELITDEGITGIAEGWGGAPMCETIERARPLFIGMDPFEVHRLAKRFSVYRFSSEQMAHSAQMKFVGSAVETAMWDILGKATGKRCGDLWGGIDKESVEFAAYLFYRYKSLDDQGGYSDPDFVANYALELLETYGFRDIKMKNGVLPPDQEVKTVRKIRDACGDRMRQIRVDPNQAWSVETSIRTLQKLEEFDIEFCEDPTWGIEGMGLVRKDSRIPLATNMCVVGFDQIATAVRSRSVDIILGDLHFWGGPIAMMQLARICDSFNIGLSMHDDRQLGISTAAVCHLAAAVPQFSHSCDSHIPEHAGDVITEPVKFVDGKVRVPNKPGLGVELDCDQLARWHKAYLEHGERDEFQDELRKGEWRPYLPLF